jgi:hypothetical protein
MVFKNYFLHSKGDSNKCVKIKTEEEEGERGKDGLWCIIHLLFKLILGQGPTVQSWTVSNSPSQPDWPGTHRDLTASASCVLKGLKVYITIPGYQLLP